MGLPGSADGLVAIRHSDFLLACRLISSTPQQRIAFWLLLLLIVADRIGCVLLSISWPNAVIASSDERTANETATVVVSQRDRFISLAVLSAPSRGGM